MDHPLQPAKGITLRNPGIYDFLLLFLEISCLNGQTELRNQDTSNWFAQVASLSVQIF